MLVIAGTIPIKGLPLTEGFCEFKNGCLSVDSVNLPLINGTSVMLAAAATVCKSAKIEKPYAILAGDIGAGEGSNQIYRFLRESFNPNSKNPVIAMHYIKPNILYAKEAIKEVKKRLKPMLIADAGSMYVAKAAKIAPEFDLFTPDPGEMAFLADSEAIHPAYVRNFIFDSINDVPELIKLAYQNLNASRFLLVKGVTDYVVGNGKITATINEPCIPALEPIGGTGDTLAGIASALIASGEGIIISCVKAALTNRFLGVLSKPNPSTKVWEMLPNIPAALEATDKKFGQVKLG